MKIILDESTPQKLRLLIDNRHIVVTTWFQGWSGQIGKITSAIDAATLGSYVFIEIGHGRG